MGKTTGIQRPNGPRRERNYLEIVKLIFKGLIPIVFLIAGVVILSLRISGWSLLLGIPLTIFGTVFLIYTYDEVLTKTLPPMPPKVPGNE